MENRTNVRALHLDSAGSWFRTEGTACEFPLTIILNGEYLVTMLCSPKDPEALAVGFLGSEGIIQTREEIRKIELDAANGAIRIRTGDGGPARKRFQTTGYGRRGSFTGYDKTEFKKRIFSEIRLSREDVLSLYHRFQKASDLYQQTHAVHSAALCDTKELLVFAEDIGRHNAVDRIIGRCILEGISFTDRLLVTSGRISAEIIAKAASFDIPVLISKSAPTDKGVDLARKAGITLIGFVYGYGMNVYAGEERIEAQGRLA